MNKYEIGQVVEKFIHHQEGVYFDLSDDGATMLVFFQNPTNKEIEQFKAGGCFEIRLTELYGVIMLTIKVGCLNWMDAPYTPHLRFRGGNSRLLVSEMKALFLNQNSNTICMKNKYTHVRTCVYNINFLRDHRLCVRGKHS